MKNKIEVLAFSLAFMGFLALTPISAHAESLSEIQVRCVHREIMPLPQQNALVSDWLKHSGCITAFAGTTASMEPAISYWDTLLLEPVAVGAQLVIGKSYVYDPAWIDECRKKMESPLILMGGIHQLVRISGDKVLFWGLNNKRADPWADRTQIKYVICRVLCSRQSNFDGKMNP